MMRYICNIYSCRLRQRYIAPSLVDSCNWQNILWLAFVLFAVLILLADDANAQLSGISVNMSLDCSGGNLIGGDNLFGQQAANAGYCSGGSAFARFFCMFETTLGIAISRVMCLLQDAWLEPLYAMLTLSMVLTGVMFVTGILDMTVKELSSFLLKLALITTFATSTPLTLEIAYGFFISLTKNTVAIVTNMFSGASFFNEPDTVVGNAQNWQGSGSVYCPMFVKTLLFISLLLFPFILLPALMAIVSYFLTFARAAAGYAYSLTMITLLLAALPIFLSLALFAVTREIFDDWLKQMGKHVINIFVIFAFLAFIQQVDIFRFVTDISNLATDYYYWVRVPMGMISVPAIPFKFCSLCGPVDDLFEISNTGLPVIKAGASCAGKTAVPLTELLTNNTFLTFLAVHLIIIYLLSVSLDRLLKMAPEFALHLGGQRYAYTLGGGGRSSSPLIGGRLQGNVMSGLKSGWQDAEGGLKKGAFLGKMAGALREASLAAIYGQRKVQGKQYTNTRRRLRQHIRRAEDRRISIQEKYTLYRNSVKQRADRRQRQARSRIRRLSAAYTRQARARARYDNLRTMKDIAAHIKNRGYAKKEELQATQNKLKDVNNNIKNIERQMHGMSVTSEEYAQAQRQQQLLKQEMAVLQKQEKYLQSWIKNGNINTEDLREIDKELQAASRLADEADREVALRESSAERAKAMEEIEESIDNIKLGILEKELRNAETAKEAASEALRKLSSSRTGGGLIDDYLDPLVEDGQGRVMRESEMLGMEQLSEDALEQQRLLAAKREEERRKQEIWYLLMRD